VCFRINEMKYFFLILFLLTYKAESCESLYDINTKIGYYCSNWKLSLTHKTNQMNDICMTNLNRGLDPSTVKIIDAERYQFSCELSEKEKKDILNKEMAEEKIQNDKDEKLRASLIKNTKNKCSSLGFIDGTAKHAKCVLELIN
jgi:hypothetical protein